MTGYRPAPGVAVVEEGDALYAAVLPDGPIVVLDGVAGVIWAEACDGPRSTLADRVAAVTDAAVADIRGDVEAFVEELVQRGLLAVRDP
ncbi:PqqD family protein [Agromyces bauzanensis]